MANEGAKGRRVMSDEAVQAELRAILEGAPLYKGIELVVDVWDAHEVIPASMTRQCERCKKPTTWQVRGGPRDIPYGLAVAYKCLLCRESAAHFWLGFEEETQGQLSRLAGSARIIHVYKAGQWPPWSIAPSKAVVAALGSGSAQLQFYKAGLVCISQSYGLGALAYFRRVVEDAVDMLLDLVQDAAESDGETATLARVAEARKQTVADEKLRLASSIVPASLRPGNINPLKRLYEDFSEGIHSLTETECLDRALAIRRTFDFILENLRERVEEVKRYREEINELGRGKKK